MSLVKVTSPFVLAGAWAVAPAVAVTNAAISGPNSPIARRRSLDMTASSDAAGGPDILIHPRCRGVPKFFARFVEELRGGSRAARDHPPHADAALSGPVRRAAARGRAGAVAGVQGQHPAGHDRSRSRRVNETRLPNRLDAPDWRYGANWDYMIARRLRCDLLRV